MANNLLEKIKKDLPNIPDQIIKDWLLPFAKEKGWPPKYETLGPILMYKPID